MTRVLHSPAHARAWAFAALPGTSGTSGAVTRTHIKVVVVSAENEVHSSRSCSTHAVQTTHRRAVTYRTSGSTSTSRRSGTSSSSTSRDAPAARERCKHSPALPPPSSTHARMSFGTRMCVMAMTTSAPRARRSAASSLPTSTKSWYRICSDNGQRGWGGHDGDRHSGDSYHVRVHRACQHARHGHMKS
jgi:hypothetical protein